MIVGMEIFWVVYISRSTKLNIWLQSKLIALQFTSSYRCFLAPILLKIFLFALKPKTLIKE